MKKSLHSVELKNVSYERNKFKFQKKFKNLTFLMATFTLLFFSLIATASHSKSISSSKNEIKLIREMSASDLSFAKDTSTAVFSSKTSLKLNTESSLVNYYVASISSLGFANPLEGDIFFNRITDNLLSYKIDYKTNKVVVNIHLEYANSSWTVADWNNYIHSKLNP
jgi:hypothetical protein